VLEYICNWYTMMPGSICICKCVRMKFQTILFFEGRISLENQDYLMNMT